MSCTKPSLISTAPATRLRGSSASALAKALMICVPPSPNPSITETSRISVFLRARSCCKTSASARSVCSARSPSSWLALRSVKTKTISLSASRSSCCKIGPASTSSTSAAANSLNHAPASLRHMENPTAKAESAAKTNQIGQLRSGSKTTPKLIAPAFQEALAREPDQTCSCP